MTAAAAPQMLSYPAPAERAINPWFVAVVVSMATFMEVLDTSIANVSLHHIAGNLGAGQDESTWVLTSYLVSNAIIMPMSGWLSSVLGRKRFYMSCVTLFTISSLLCGLAPNLASLLVFRVLQGIGGGGLAPSEQSILADTFPRKQLGTAFAIYGLAVVFAPAIGPSLGGWITDNYDWRWIFFINVPVGCISLLLTHYVVHDTAAAKKEHEAVKKRGFRVDYIGFGLTAIGLGALQIVLDKGQEDDWFGSNFICIVAAIALAGIVGLVIWESFFVENPIVDIPLLANRNLSSSMVLLFVVGFILNATTVLMPQFVQTILGYNATNAGLILMPGGFTLVLMMPIAGFLSGKVQPKYLIAVGLGLTSLAVYHLTTFNTGVPFSYLAMARVFQCIGLPLFFVPLNTIAYGNLPAGKSNNASALMNLMRNLGGGIGISIAATILVRRSQFHQARLASHLTRYDWPFVHWMRGGPSGGAGSGPLYQAYAMVQQQAAMLAYLDVFKIMSFVCLVVLVLVLMIRPTKPSAEAMMAH